jgi:hypothetical protein
MLRIVDRIVAPRAAVALLLSLLQSLHRALYLAQQLLALALALVLYLPIIFAPFLMVLLTSLHLVHVQLVLHLFSLVLARCSSCSSTSWYRSHFHLVAVILVFVIIRVYLWIRDLGSVRIEIVVLINIA